MVPPYFPYDILQKNSLRLIDQSEESILMRKMLGDGVIGHGWFGGRVWRLSYSEKKLTLLKRLSNPPGIEIPMGFKSDTHFYPRIQIKVAGETLDVLLDTGATSFFSLEAMQRLELSSAFSASNFIRKSVFDSWRSRYPDWIVIEKGDRFGNNPIIRVPEVQLANKTIGPVWFAMRPNDSYDKFMAEYMDCKCAGAIGGTVFKAFNSITLDYPNKAAWFEN